MPSIETISRVARILAQATSPESEEANSAVQGAYKRMVRDQVSIEDLLSLPLVELYQEALVQLVIFILENQPMLSPQERRKSFENYLQLITERFAEDAGSSANSSRRQQNPNGGTWPNNSGAENAPRGRANGKSKEEHHHRKKKKKNANRLLKISSVTVIGLVIAAAAFGGYFLLNNG